MPDEERKTKTYFVNPITKRVFSLFLLERPSAVIDSPQRAKDHSHHPGPSREAANLLPYSKQVTNGQQSVQHLAMFGHVFSDTRMHTPNVSPYTSSQDQLVLIE